ncbi:hypothetical protein DB41_GA00040 [Neochlamydia sp. TUME1]|nr:hypothetical protein DB41_GA00040 [Neochlamydia sp. TUME1]
MPAACFFSFTFISIIDFFAIKRALSGKAAVASLPAKSPPIFIGCFYSSSTVLVEI